MKKIGNRQRAKKECKVEECDHPEKKGTDCLEKEGMPAEGSKKTATYVRFNV